MIKAVLWIFFLPFKVVKFLIEYTFFGYFFGTHLSAFKYFIRNFTKFLPLMVIIACSITAMSVTMSAARSVTNDKEESIRFYQKYAIIRYKNLESKSEAQKELTTMKNEGLIDDYTEIHSSVILSSSIAGNPPRPFLALNKDQLPKVLSTIGVTNLDQIKFDYNNDLLDIFLSQKLLDNKKLKVGGEFNTNRDNKELRLNSKYKVSGVLEFNSQKSAVPVAISAIGSNEPINSFLISVQKSNHDVLASRFDQLFLNNYQLQIEHYNQILSLFADESASVNKLLDFVNFIITTVVTLSIGLLFFMYLNSRGEELGILLVLGYSKVFVLLKLLIEGLVLIINSWFISIITTYYIFEVINQAIFYPKAMGGMTLFDQKTFANTFVIPICVLATTFFTTTFKLARFNPITILEMKS
jgi:ABC-type lipoprotein release transport system permease subunit